MCRYNLLVSPLASEAANRRGAASLPILFIHTDSDGEHCSPTRGYVTPQLYLTILKNTPHSVILIDFIKSGYINLAIDKAAPVCLE